MTIRTYYRVSTDKQDFEMQEEAIQKLCKGNNIDYNSCIIYKDYGLSGTTDQRPDYQRLLAEVDEYDTILVYEFSRLWRDIGEQSRATKMLKALNVTILSYSDGKLDNNTDMLIVNIKGCINQYEAERLSKRTKDGLAAKRARCDAGLDVWKYRGKDKIKRSSEGYIKEQARRRALRNG